MDASRECYWEGQKRFSCHVILTVFDPWVCLQEHLQNSTRDKTTCYVPLFSGPAFILYWCLSARKARHDAHCKLSEEPWWILKIGSHQTQCCMHNNDCGCIGAGYRLNLEAAHLLSVNKDTNAFPWSPADWPNWSAYLCEGPLEFCRSTTAVLCGWGCI